MLGPMSRHVVVALVLVVVSVGCSDAKGPAKAETPGPKVAETKSAAGAAKGAGEDEAAVPDVSADRGSEVAAPEPTKAEPDTGPPPPEGVMVPRGGVVVRADDGGGRAAYLWKGLFTADPSDPQLQASIAAATSTGEVLTANGALLRRYEEDVKAAGTSTTGSPSSPGFHYMTTGATPYAVFVRLPADDPHGPPPDPSQPTKDDNGPLVEIVVSTPGG